MQTTQFTSPGFDYAADVSAIERKRKLQEALQAQAFQPIQEQPVGQGQFATRISPLQGAAKLAQAFVATRQGKKADELSRDLAKRAQADLTNSLTAGNAALQGTPGKTINPDPQEYRQSADYGTPEPEVKNTPGTAPYSPEAISNAAAIYMRHPALQGLGTSLAQENITTQQQLARALAATGVDSSPTPATAPAPNVPGAAVAGGAPQPTQVAGQAQPLPQGAPQQPQGQFDRNGVPLDLSRSLQLGDPKLGKYWDYVKQLREPKMSANGQVMQYQQLPGGGWGYAPGAGAVAAARAFADVGEASRAAHDIVSIKVDGRDVQMTRAEAVRRFGEQSVPPQQPQTQQPLPQNVPESDRAAYEAVAGGKVSAAYGPQPAQKTSGFGVGETGAEQAFSRGSAENAVKYRAAMNEKVQTGQDLMMRINESEGLLKQFQAGAGEGVRVKAAELAQAVGAPQTVVDGLSRGDLGSAQAFQKIVVSQAMESLKQAMASSSGTGAGRITQAEFQIFQKANPNLELDPRALTKIYAFARRVHDRDYSEQQDFQKWVDDKKDPASFPSYWATKIESGLKAENLKGIVSSGTSNVVNWADLGKPGGR